MGKIAETSNQLTRTALVAGGITCCAVCFVWLARSDACTEENLCREVAEREGADVVEKLVLVGQGVVSGVAARCGRDARECSAMAQDGVCAQNTGACMRKPDQIKNGF